MLTENKFGKYLMYALGEIALVMIGILLAVQVNDWNEARHRRTEEISLLIGLRSDLKLKIEEMQKIYGYNNKLHQRTTQFILSQLNHQDITLDTKEFLFLGDFYPIFNTHITSLEVAVQGNTINIFRKDTLVLLLRNLKMSFLTLEKDSNYQDVAENSFLTPFWDNSGLAIHRFGQIHAQIEPDPAILEGIDRKDLANKLSQIALIQANWLDKQKTILEDMHNLLPIVQAELER